MALLLPSKAALYFCLHVRIGQILYRASAHPGHMPFNQRVAGSTPAGLTSKIKLLEENRVS
jgi:hypothetical protein